jgi:predicted nucleotidyltransferase
VRNLRAPSPAAIKDCRGKSFEVRRSIMPKTTKATSVRARIDDMVRRIVRKFQPEQVILFGSHARGEAGPDSDVDLLVVMDFEGSALDKRVDLRQALQHIPVPKDIIVSRPADFDWRKDVIGTIEWPAAREGKVLYVRPQSRRRRAPRVDRQGGQ